MSKSKFVSLVVFILLTACGGIQDLSLNSINATETSVQNIASLPTSVPTETLLPKIPTPTPSPVPSPTEIPVKVNYTCPEANPEIEPEFLNVSSFDELHEIDYPVSILEYLNGGGNPLLINDLAKKSEFPIRVGLQVQDITNDSVPEIIVNYTQALPVLMILGCRNGSYQTLVKLGGEWGVEIYQVIDLNQDQMPEIIIYVNDCNCIAGLVIIYEWNGSEMTNLTDGEFIDFYGGTYDDSPRFQIYDVDGNGTLELILAGGNSSSPITYSQSMPNRNEIQTVMWDGKYFSVNSVIYSPPDYRHQAVQDGDRAAVEGDYKKALSFYQDAIFSKDLKIWTPDDKAKANEEGGFPPPIPTAASLDIYYDQISAYARYRIMLIHLTQGYVNEAEIVYENLVALYPIYTAGYPYVEMATAFWEEYSSTSDMASACSKAIDYAEAHPEILEPIGSEYHGGVDKIYKPADVCPFE